MTGLMRIDNPYFSLGFFPFLQQRLLFVLLHLVDCVDNHCDRF